MLEKCFGYRVQFCLIINLISFTNVIQKTAKLCVSSVRRRCVVKMFGVVFDFTSSVQYCHRTEVSRTCKVRIDNMRLYDTTVLKWMHWALCCFSFHSMKIKKFVTHTTWHLLSTHLLSIFELKRWHVTLFREYIEKEKKKKACCIQQSPFLFQFVVRPLIKKLAQQNKHTLYTHLHVRLRVIDCVIVTDLNQNEA